MGPRPGPHLYGLSVAELFHNKDLEFSDLQAEPPVQKNLKQNYDGKYYHHQRQGHADNIHDTLLYKLTPASELLVDDFVYQSIMPRKVLYIKYL